MLHVSIYLEPSLNNLNAHSDSLDVLMAVDFPHDFPHLYHNQHCAYAAVTVCVK